MTFTCIFLAIQSAEFQGHVSFAASLDEQIRSGAHQLTVFYLPNGWLASQTEAKLSHYLSEALGWAASGADHYVDLAYCIASELINRWLARMQSVATESALERKGMAKTTAHARPQ